MQPQLGFLYSDPQIQSGIFNYIFFDPQITPSIDNFLQSCGAGAGGAEIIWGPGAGAENKFKETYSAVSLEDARTSVAEPVRF